MRSISRIEHPLQPSQRFKDSLFEEQQAIRMFKFHTRQIKKPSRQTVSLVPTLIGRQRHASQHDIEYLDSLRDAYN